MSALLEVRDISRSFSGLKVLKGVSFAVTPGEVFVIMGPSGSGKSVLLKHLIGLETPDAGEILINGEPISGELMSRFRMAMVFQSGARLNSLTVGENVGLYLAEHRLHHVGRGVGEGRQSADGLQARQFPQDEQHFFNWCVIVGHGPRSAQMLGRYQS